MIFKTTNGGANWDTLTLGTQMLYAINSIPQSSGDTAYAVGGGGIFRRTTNGGVNWSSQLLSGNSNLLTIFFTSLNTGFVAGLGSYIAKTTNGGVNWINQTVDVAGAVRGLFFVNPDTGYLVGDGGPSHLGIYWTTNGGVNWVNQTSSLASSLESVCFPNANTGYIVSDQGRVLKTTSGGVLTAINQINQDVPHLFSLFQNYPNPFNPTTKIKFALPPLSLPPAGGDAEWVRLSLYDILGHEAAVLVNEKLKPGTYETDWDASDYPSGIYYYQLTVGDFRVTKKMILVK